MCSETKNNYNHKHKDSLDVLTVFVTLGGVTTGGSTTFFVPRKTEPVFKIPFQHGNLVMGQLNEVEHGTEKWNGDRIVLSFYLHRDMFNFFKKQGSTKIYDEYCKLNFPRNDAIAIKYNSDLDTVESCSGKWTKEVLKNTGNFYTLRKYLIHEKQCESLHKEYKKKKIY